ncbi:MAG: hypothetical protein SCM88_13680, partial [Bacillota bacterium]|nr:hypothetical protein [Bacillota bacterium]
EFQVNGEPLVVRKTHREIWRKEPDTGRQVFSGHDTEYVVNGVSTTMTDYQKTLHRLVPAEVLPLLINPAGFNELHWKERRRILLACCGDITDEEVIAANPDLAEVPELLGDRDSEEYTKVLKTRLSLTEKKKDDVKTRHEETCRKIPAEMLSDPEAEGIKKSLAAIDTQIRKVREIIASLGGDELLAELRRDWRQAQEKVLILTRLAKDRHSKIEELISKMENLRRKWAETDKMVFTFTDICTCPLCGQLIPENMRLETREKALAQFEADKAQKLADITRDGREAGNDLEYLTTAQQEEGKELQETEADLETLQQYLKDMEDGCLQEAKMLQEQLDALTAKGDVIREKLAYTVAAELARERAEELMEERNSLAAECQALEAQIRLLERFTRARMQLLQERVNRHFTMARFRLFEEQVKGGFADCCETLYEGVPYGTNLNDGHRVQVGVDIINTLSRHYGVTLPLFIDRRESIDDLPPTNAQVISFFNSRKDTSLRMEADHTIEPLGEMEPLGEPLEAGRRGVPLSPELIAEPAAMPVAGPGF